MNTRYLGLLATLVFLVFSAPAEAHDCSRHDDKTHKHCSDDGPQTTYTVEVKEDEMIGGVDATGTCAGFTTSSKRSVRFPAGCGQVELDGGLFDLFGIDVKFTKKGASAFIFFISTCCAPSNSVYNTDNLPGLMEPADDAAAAFQIVLNLEDVVLTKVHEPNKGTMLTDTISVGKIVYIADPQ